MKPNRFWVSGIGDAQKPSIVGEDPNAAQQAGAGQAAGIDVTQQQGANAQQAAAGAGQAAGTGVANLIPGVDVKLPETVANTTGFDVRPAGTNGEVRDLVDTDGKVKDGTGSMGTGNAKAGSVAPAQAAQGQGSAAPAAIPAVPQQAVAAPAKAAAPAAQQDKAASNNDATPVEKKPVPKWCW